MKLKPLAGSKFFFATAPMPCPYISGRIERRVVTELFGRDVNALHDALTLTGYRRSHGIAYAPVCPNCQSCVAVRIPVARFTPSRTQRRTMSRNKDLTVTVLPPTVTEEQYDLFARYLKTRHAGGDMEKMELHDFQSLVEDTPVDTVMVEFRDANDTLLAACLTDRAADGLSAVYSFYDTDAANRSLGTHIILWLVDYARSQGLDHVYLGYWIAESPKMSYKAAFRPIEAFGPDGWVDLTGTPT